MDLAPVRCKTFHQSAPRSLTLLASRVTIAKTQVTRLALVAFAAVAILATAAFYRLAGQIDRNARAFSEDVLHQDWPNAFNYMSVGEKRELGLSKEEFVKFSTAFSSAGWPKADHLTLEEQTPFVAPGAEVDTSWNTAGTRKFAITFRRPDGAVDLVSKLQFRHDQLGEWHPDVFSFIFSIGSAVPHGNPVKGLIAGLVACGRKNLTAYPLHQTTSLQELRQVEATHKGFYLRSAPEPLH